MLLVADPHVSEVEIRQANIRQDREGYVSMVYHIDPTLQTCTERTKGAKRSFTMDDLLTGTKKVLSMMNTGLHPDIENQVVPIQFMFSIRGAEADRYRIMPKQAGPLPVAEIMGWGP